MGSVNGSEAFDNARCVKQGNVLSSLFLTPAWNAQFGNSSCVLGSAALTLEASACSATNAMPTIFDICAS
eukprot:1231768-Pyramimonas_sp.AAC.1